jgi:DNA-binding transcriptional MocR family regulator
MWTPATRPGTGPYYVALADALSRDVEEGRLAPGTRLPTHRELAQRLGVTVGTVSRAYAEAARRGAIQGEVGRGTFVLGHLRRRPAAVERPRDAIDLAYNVPLEPAARRGIADVLAEIAREEPAWLFEGYHVAGLEAHRAAGARWLAEGGLEVAPERVLVTGGAQHGMAVVLATLARSSDVILTEALTYTGVKALAGTLGLRLEPVACDAEGLDPDAFDAACRRHAPRALYTMPTLQNPTGSVLSADRRAALVAVAREHGVALVEDDTYARLCPAAPPALAHLAPELTYYLTGTAKALSAGLRVGYVVAPTGGASEDGARVVERLSASVAGLTWMSTPLTAEIVSRWIRSGVALSIPRTKAQEIQARRALFEKLLPRVPSASHRASPHLWLELPEPWRAEAFVEAARARGVLVSPPELFTVGRAAAPHAVRVCLGTPHGREALERGLRILAELLSSRPPTRAALV